MEKNPKKNVCAYIYMELPRPPPGELPDPGIEPLSLTSSALAGGFFTTSAAWEALCLHTYIHIYTHTHVYVNYFSVHLKLTQYCKATTRQLNEI